MRRCLPAVLALSFASPAAAACYADYKAKQDGPLSLHYGVMEIPTDRCSVDAAEDIVADRLDEGWTLLQVVGVFDEAGLEERRANAGEFYLRY